MSDLNDLAAAARDASVPRSTGRPSQAAQAQKPIAYAATPPRNSNTAHTESHQPPFRPPIKDLLRAGFFFTIGGMIAGLAASIAWFVIVTLAIGTLMASCSPTRPAAPPAQRTNPFFR